MEIRDLNKEKLDSLEQEKANLNRAMDGLNALEQ